MTGLIRGVYIVSCGGSAVDARCGWLSVQQQPGRIAEALPLPRARDAQSRDPEAIGGEATDPEQNGLIERFFRSLKEECVWQHDFANFSHERRGLIRWLDDYNR